MKTTFTHSAALIWILAILLPAAPAYAQFQRAFGTPLDESFSKVIQSGTNYYVLGSGEIVDGQSPRATVTRLNASGQLQWTLSLNVASEWNDAVLTPSGNLLVVGNSLPNGNSSQSIMGQVTAAGAFSWVRSYESPGDETFKKIVRNPLPQNAAFPYYILGSQTDPVTMNADMVLLNCNESGAFNWKKIYTGPIFFTGNKFARDLEALPNGDMLLAANLDVQGVVLRIDNTGQAVSGATPEFLFSVTDLTQGSGGTVYAIGTGIQDSKVHLMKFDSDLIGLWDYTISGAGEASQVIQAPGNGDTYVMGKKFIELRPCMFRISETSGFPDLTSVKLLNGNSTAQTGGTLSLVSANQLAYADGRSIPVIGFGQFCAFLALTDLSLSSCIAAMDDDILLPNSTIFSGPLPPDPEFYDVPMGVNLTGSLRTWQQGEACSVVPCVADFNFEFLNCDPTVSFINASTGPAPLTYSWSFGYSVLGIPQTSIAANPFHTFPAQCGTYNVCLTVTGNDCSNTICKDVIIKYTQSPVFNCPPNTIVNCNTSLAPAITGFATLTGACSGVTPSITYSDVVNGIMPCDASIIRTWSVTDECGQTHTCVQTILVQDNVPPTINCPQDLTVNTNPGQCYYTGSVPQPTATDNCNPNPVVTCYLVTDSGLVPITPQTQFPKGTNTICCIADDGCVEVSELICTYSCVSGGGNFQELNPPVQFVQTPDNSPIEQLLTTLAVQPAISGDVLVRDVLVGGNCFDISNITTQGQASQLGTFSNGLTNVGFESGVILATGQSTLAIGPNNSDNAGSGAGGVTPDADLATLTTGTLYDRASLEFDFIPTQPTVTFRFVYASEGYCEQVGNPLNDVLGFFISGPGIPSGTQNIALVPATTTPVNTNTVNHQSNSGFYVNNQPASSANLCGQPASTLPSVTELQYDGYTRKFTAVANVQPGQTYHLKLAIADVGDDLNDSAVFLDAGSFDAGGDASVEWAVNSNPISAVAYENCGTVNLVFDRAGGSINLPLTVAYTITGNATAGFDYAPFASSVIIPAGQSQFILPVTILNDAILEGDETIVVTLNSVCSFLTPQKTLTIKDKALLQAKCTFTLTVEDHELPMITCQPNVTVSGIADGTGSCNAVVYAIAPTASDNCPMLMVDYSITGATTATGMTNASLTTFSEGTSTVTYAATDMSGNMATCQTEVTVVCDFGSSCDCPVGGTQGPNLIVNGDFSAGNTGFTSDYTFTGGAPSGPNTYAISNSNILQFSNFFNCLDHTNGTLTGQFLTADGSLTSGQAAWRQNVPVTSSTSYEFCAYVNNIWWFYDNSSDPDVQVWIVDGNNNATLLTSAVLPEVPDFWVKLSASWTAPAVLVSPYRLEIRSGSIIQGGNDFAVDDISFKSCSAPQPCDVTIIATYVDNCGHVQLDASASGPSGYSYQWCSGESTQMLDLMLPCGEHDFCVSVTCSDGTMASDAITVTVSDNIPPTINCPQDMTITALHPNCDISVHSIHSLGASDNCGTPTEAYAISGATVASGQGDASGTTFNSGTSTLTYTATDWCNNTSSCSFDVTIDCDTCACLGFQNMEFYNFLGAPNIPTDCENAPVALPCIGSDALYWFQWSLLCSNPLCQQSFSYSIIPMGGGPALVSGTLPFGSPPFLSFSYNQLSGPGNYTIILTGYCGTDSCVCHINFSVPSCCNCGGFSDMTWRPTQGGFTQSVACGDTLATPCDQVFFPRVGGLFQCTGTQCPMNQTIQWVLKDPSGTPIQSGPLTFQTNFLLALDPNWFVQSGIYTLTFNGNCGGQMCPPCVLYLESAGCECCDDYDAFLSVATAVQANAQISNCSISANATGLDDCFQVSWNWGDGSPVEGPFPDNTPVAHNYAGSASLPYTACYTITEYNMDGDSCWAAEFCLEVPCDTCAIVPTGLVAWWPMDETGSETTIYDITSFYAAATLPGAVGAGGPNPVPGKVDVTGTSLGALEFIGPGSASLSNPGTINAFNFGSGTFSIDAWIKTDMPTQTAPIVDKIANQTNGYAFSIQGTPALAFPTLAIGTSSGIEVFQGPAIAVGQWNFVGVVVNPPNVDFYVGGDPGGSSSFTSLSHTLTGTPNASNNLPVLIGKNPLNPHWQIVIDELEIFRDPLGPLEMRRIWAADALGKCQPFDDCACGSIFDLYIQGKSITCGGNPVTVGCPQFGNKHAYVVAGKFDCVGDCPPQQTINWTLTGPNGSNSGYVQKAYSPYFAIGLSPLFFTQNGLYTLTMTGHCGNSACTPCVIQFNVSCPVLCPCDPEDFAADLGKGFSSTTWNNLCKACFSPNELTDCDMVEWFVYGTSVGMASGTQTFCHTFPAAGIYNVMMSVTRKKSDGTICATNTFARNITISCITIGDCSDSVFPNPRFNEGAIGGGLNSGGASDGWNSPWGDPVVVEGEPGSTDAWTIQLSGNADTSDVLSTIQPVCLEKSSGTLTVRFGIKEQGIKATMAIQLYREEGFEVPDSSGTWNPIRCLRLASIDLSPFEEGWYELEVPYDLSNWETLDDCGDEVAVLARPAVYITNALNSLQGGAETYSIVHIDNFCFDSRLVGIKEPSRKLPLRIYPNPNSGAFTLELPEAATSGMSLRILNLTGQVLLEQRTETGSTRQAVEAGALPSGLYFVQVLEAGEVVGIGRFVKQ